MTEEIDPQATAAEQAQTVQAEAVPDTVAAAQPEVDVDALQAELARVTKALGEAELRAQAEIQNMRRRVESEAEKARKFAIEKFARDVLAVADSLERGLKSVSAEDAALKPAREGIELTLKQLLDVLARAQIEQIDPAGAPFDPEKHEAMTQIPAPGAEPNTVIDVLEKGYALNGRLLRPARVVVSK